MLCFTLHFVFCVCVRSAKGLYCCGPGTQFHAARWKAEWSMSVTMPSSCGCFTHGSLPAAQHCHLDADKRPCYFDQSEQTSDWRIKANKPGWLWRWHSALALLTEVSSHRVLQRGLDADKRPCIVNEENNGLKNKGKEAGSPRRWHSDLVMFSAEKQKAKQAFPVT